MMKEFLTNDLFDKATYIDCLARIGVEAQATENGVLLNMTQYKANYKISTAPNMVTINHKWVKAL